MRVCEGGREKERDECGSFFFGKMGLAFFVKFLKLILKVNFVIIFYSFEPKQYGFDKSRT